MIAFRHADPRYPFLWEGSGQPAGRWHGEGEGPAHYLADTPDGAWAEFLRHEEITDPSDLEHIRRTIWAVEIDDTPGERPAVPEALMTGDVVTYPACQAEARRQRQRGVNRLLAPSAALLAGAASGWRVAGGLQPGPARDGYTIVLFGERPSLVGWRAAAGGGPGLDVLAKVRHFGATGRPRRGARSV